MPPRSGAVGPPRGSLLACLALLLLPACLALAPLPPQPPSLCQRVKGFGQRVQVRPPRLGVPM